MLNILEHLKIHECNKIQRRIRHNHYSMLAVDQNYTPEGDQLALFTIIPEDEEPVGDCAEARAVIDHIRNL